MKPITVAVIIAVVFISGAFVLTRGTSVRPSDTDPVNNVSMVEGNQIIEIRAKGGYQPNKSYAQAGIPTVLRFETSGTFDCSSAVRIPSMNISKTLPQTGSTDIAIGTQAAGTFKGTCGMGMYPFEVEFSS